MLEREIAVGDLQPGDTFRVNSANDNRLGIWLGEKVLILNGVPASRHPHIAPASGVQDPIVKLTGKWSFDENKGERGHILGDLQMGDVVLDSHWGLVVIAEAEEGGITGVALNAGLLTQGLTNPKVWRGSTLQLFQEHHLLNVTTDIPLVAR